MHGKTLLIVVLVVLGTAGLITWLFFWHVWRGPKEEETSDERVEDVLGYGWNTRMRRTAKKASAVLNGFVMGVKGEQVLQEKSEDVV